MLKMSFYDGTLNVQEAMNFINTTEKPCVYTYGLEYKNPTTHRKPLSKEEAIRLIQANGLIDVIEEEYVIHVKEVSCNDMW